MTGERLRVHCDIGIVQEILGYGNALATLVNGGKLMENGENESFERSDPKATKICAIETVIYALCMFSSFIQ